MTDGTSQGLFIVVAIVIFGIFTVLAYILFEDTLSPALASMFTDATEEASKRLSNKKYKLLASWNKEVKTLNNREFITYVDLAPVFDEHGIGTYHITFDLKSDNKQGRVLVYLNNNSDSRYSFAGNKYVESTSEYSSHFIESEIRFNGENVKESRIAFFGTYGTGVYTSVKNMKVYKLIE